MTDHARRSNHRKLDDLTEDEFKKLFGTDKATLAKTFTKAKRLIRSGNTEGLVKLVEKSRSASFLLSKS